MSEIKYSSPVGWTARKQPPGSLPLHLSTPLVNFFKNSKYTFFVLFLTFLSLSSVCIIFSNLLVLFTSISCCLLFPFLSCICLKLHLLGVNYPFCFFQFLPSCFCDPFFFFLCFLCFTLVMMSWRSVHPLVWISCRGFLHSVLQCSFIEGFASSIYFKSMMESLLTFFIYHMIKFLLGE